MSFVIVDCLFLWGGAVVVPGRSPAFLLGDDLRGVVQLGNIAQAVIKVYEFVAEVEEGTASAGRC